MNGANCDTITVLPATVYVFRVLLREYPSNKFIAQLLLHMYKLLHLLYTFMDMVIPLFLTVIMFAKQALIAVGSQNF